MKAKMVMASAIVLTGMVGVIAPTAVAAEESTGTIELIAPENPGEGGNLVLNQVTEFDFGQQEISGQKVEYTLVDPTAALPTQISDLRGTGEGWNVSVAITKFLDGDKELKGAVLALPAGNLTSSESQSAAPSANELTVNDSAQTAITAAVDSGLGVWDKDYSGAKLTVPQGNLAGNYSATLTWTLTDGPA